MVYCSIGGIAINQNNLFITSFFIKENLKFKALLVDKKAIVFQFIFLNISKSSFYKYIFTFYLYITMSVCKEIFHYMYLIVFAHRGEASYFLQNFTYETIILSSGIRLFKTDKHYLLISGEGIHNTMFSISSVLSYMSNFHLIINLGIAGAFQGTVKKNIVYPIRTVYKQKYLDYVEFQSFNSIEQENKKAVDCMSCLERIFQKEYKINVIAKIIDRELWSIGYVCDKMKIPFVSGKFISDYVTEDIRCLEIQKKSNIYSKALFDYYYEYFSKYHKNSLRVNSTEKKIIKEENFLQEILKQLAISIETFYYTQSQKDKLEKVLPKIKRLYSQMGDDFWKSLLLIFDFFKSAQQYQKGNRKAITNLLINTLESMLFPYFLSIHKKINQSIENLKNNGIRVNYDKNLEKEEISLHFPIKNQKDLEKKILALKNFSWEEYQNIFLGEWE